MSDFPGESTETHARRAVSVTTGSRLHFGLLRPVAPFGGLGVMIDSPETMVVAEPSTRFDCHVESGIHEDTVSRVVQIAQRFAASVGMQTLPAVRVTVKARPEAHFGLGSGTQLSMAVAESVAASYSQCYSPERLARDIAGRGHRSAVGIHGYFRGGLIFENSSDQASAIQRRLNPIHARLEVPVDWRVVLFRPCSDVATVSGDCEQENFVQTSSAPRESCQRLVAIAQNELLPAVNACDFGGFADAVQRFNHASGLLFEAVQGGPYNGSEITWLVNELCSRGAVGVGQSSWGPSVFSWFESESLAQEFVAELPDGFAECLVTRARNVPRQVEPTKSI